MEKPIYLRSKSGVRESHNFAITFSPKMKLVENTDHYGTFESSMMAQSWYIIEFGAFLILILLIFVKVLNNSYRMFNSTIVMYVTGP